MAAETKDGAQNGAASQDAKLGMADAAGPKAAPGSVPMGKRGAIYTMTAREGLGAAELVNATLAKKTVGKLTPRRVEVAAPDGPSTSGGKHARQTIRLVPASGAGAPVMCGFLDVSQKAVELRGFRSVAQQYRERFGTQLDITMEEYDALLKDLQATFSVFQYTVTHEPEDQVVAPRAARAQFTSEPPVKERSPLVNMALIALALLGVIGVAFTIFKR